MSVNVSQQAVRLAKTSVQNFRRLSRYYPEALYPGEHEFVAEIIRRLEQSFTREDGEKSRQLPAQQSATSAIEQMIDRGLVKFDPKKQ